MLWIKRARDVVIIFGRDHHLKLENPRLIGGSVSVRCST